MLPTLTLISRKMGENIVVSVEHKEVGRIPPIHNLEGGHLFWVYGSKSGRDGVMCISPRGGLAFVSPYGKFLGRVSGRVSGNVLLRKRQYLLSDDEEAAARIAMNCVLGKMLNCRSVLLRFGRDYPEKVSPEFSERLQWLTEGVRQLRESPSDTLNELRGGREGGILSKCYFDCFDDLILSQDPAFAFESRSRRPPVEPGECSTVVCLYADRGGLRFSSRIRGGLIRRWGFLHRARPGADEPCAGPDGGVPAVSRRPVCVESDQQPGCCGG